MENISEQLFLVAQNPKKKTSFVNGIYCSYGLVGALLLEMADEELILVKEKKLHINAQQTTNVPIYNEVLTWIKKSSKIRKLDYWVRFLAQKSKSLRDQLFQSLDDQRMIKIHQLKFLGIPYRKIELKGRLERKEIVRNLKASLQQPNDISELDYALLMLLKTCSLTKEFKKSRSELKSLFKNLQEKMELGTNNQILNPAITEIRKAILTSVMVSSVGPITAS